MKVQRTERRRVQEQDAARSYEQTLRLEAEFVSPSRSDHVILACRTFACAVGR